MTSLFLLAFCLFACACTDQRSREPVNEPRSSFVQRTVDTSLSQEDWPSTEGNEVRIHYRDLLTTEISVSIYGETGRSEDELVAFRGRITSGISRTLRYRTPIYDDPSNIVEDTCAFSFTISDDGTVHCTEELRTPTNQRVQCTSCVEQVPVITKIVHDVELLMDHHLR